MMRGRDSEGGSVHILETTVVMVVMFSAITTVVIMESPVPTPFTPIERELGAKAWDLLHLAEEHAIAGRRCDGDDVLERLVSDGMRGLSGGWEAWRKKFFADGTDVSLFLDNGFDLMALHNPSTFRGVAQTLYLDPNDSYSLALPLVSTVSGVEDLTIATATVRGGALTRVLGDVVEFRVRYNELSVDGIERSVASPAAVLGATADAMSRRGAQNLTWQNETSRPTLSKSFTDADLTGPVTLRLSLAGLSNESLQPAAFPNRTALTIKFPAGWTGIESTSPSWEAVGETTSAGTTVRLTKTLGALETQLRLQATPPSAPTRPFDVIHARLENGSYGESTLVVKYPTTASTQRDLPRLVYPTVPYPMRGGSTALFGVAFANGGAAVNVTDVYVTVPGGYDLVEHLGAGAPLFADHPAELVDTRVWDDPLWPEASGTWTRVSEKQWRWHGEREVPALGAEYWAVGLKINPASIAATSVEPEWGEIPRAEVTFGNGFGKRGSQWGSVPGVIEVSVPPAPVGTSDGYPLDLGVHGFDTEVGDEWRGVAGEGEFRMLVTATDVSNVRHAVTNSSLRVEKRLVPAGSVVEVRAELDSLATTLASLGVANPNVTVELYTPLTRACPVKTIETTLDGLPAPDISDVLLWDGGSLVDSVYAASGDGRVYRLGAAGATLAYVEHGGTSAILARGQVSGGEALLVGNDEGVVRAFHPTTGAPLWQVDPSTHGGTGAITVLQYNATSTEVLVGTSGGRLVRLAADNGSVVASEPVLDTIGQVREHEDGSLYVSGGRKIARVTSTFTVITVNEFADGIPGFAVGKDRVILPQAATYLLLDKATLAPVGGANAYDHTTSPAVLATPADIDADGHEDLLVARQNNLVSVIYGVDGQDTVIWGGESVSVSAWEVYGVEQADCRPSSYPNRYITPVVCGQELGASAGPSVLVAQGDRFLMTYMSDQPRIVVGERLQTRVETASCAAPVTALGFGDWGGPGVAYGCASGVVAVQDEDWNERMTSAPSARVGTAAFFFNIPRGGSLGTHLVRLEVSWDDAGKKQAANLYDWLEVVSPEGIPVLDPIYKVVLVAQDATLPHEYLPGRATEVRGRRVRVSTGPGGRRARAGRPSRAARPA